VIAALQRLGERHDVRVLVAPPARLRTTTSALAHARAMLRATGGKCNDVDPHAPATDARCDCADLDVVALDAALASRGNALAWLRARIAPDGAPITVSVNDSVETFLDALAELSPAERTAGVCIDWLDPDDSTGVAASCTAAHRIPAGICASRSGDDRAVTGSRETSRTRRPPRPAPRSAGNGRSPAG
jgi:hypothetical protein